MAESRTRYEWGRGGRGGGGGGGRGQHSVGTSEEEVPPLPAEGIVGGETLEACRSYVHLHSHAHTVCWAHNQRASVGPGSQGGTAVPSDRTSSCIDATTCMATPPAHGGRQVPVNEELLMVRCAACCVLCDFVQQSKGLVASEALHLVTQWYSTAGLGAGAA